MKSSLTAICLTLSLSLGTINAAWSADFRPSFDCAKARTQTENLTCSETTLAEMDGALGRVYVSLRSTLSSSQADALLDEQRRWLKSRDKACGLKGRGRVKASQRNQKVDCLRHQLAARLGELESLLPVTARADFQKGVAAYDAGDYATALRELTPLAEQGNADAQTYLGVMYQNGGGVPQDDKTAVKWYDLVAKRPPPGTEVVPGAIGSLSPTIPRRPTTPCIPPTPCVPQDDKTAVKWYRLAAKQGHAGAQNNLGFLYMIGQGVPQNYQTAIKWFRISAKQGFSLAQNNLGLLYVKGQGVVQDYVYAHMWWNIAASSGNKSAGTNRDKVAGMMTPSQIAEAQDLARECVRKKYKDC